MHDETPKWAWWSLALLTLVTLALRLTGIGFMLPHAPEPDAVIVWRASYLDRPAGEGATPLAQSATYYPTLLSDLVYLAPGHSYPYPAPLGASDDEHRAAASAPYLKARYVIALISVLVVPALFFVARRFFEPGWSLFAAALVATSLLDTAYAQQARPHTASASVNLIAMIGVLALLKTPSWRSYLVAGLAAMLALATLHNGVFVLPGLLLAHWFVRERRWWAFAAALTLMLAALPIFYPWLFVNGIFAPHKGGELDIGGQELRWDLLSGAGYGQIARGLFSYDPLLCLFALGGLVLGVVTWWNPATRPRAAERKALLVVASFPATFVLLWGIMSVVQARFVISLVPYLALLAVFLVRHVVRRFALAPALATTLALGVLALPSLACTKLVWLRAHPDTFTLAAGWLAQHADRAKDRIGLDFLYSLPLRQQQEGMANLPDYARGPWERYQLALGPSVAGQGWFTLWLFRAGMIDDKILSAAEAASVVREEEASYAVVIVPWDLAAEHDFTRAGVRPMGELVYALHPYDLRHTELFGSGYEQGWHAFEKVMRAEVWGPPIEIYRMK